MIPNQTASLRTGYKHVTVGSHVFHTQVVPPEDIITPFICLNRDGWLFIAEGYAWDGATGCPDVALILRASLIHDALYQLIREKHLAYFWRQSADLEFRNAILEDGKFLATHSPSWLKRKTAKAAAKVLAETAYLAVQAFGEPSATPGSSKPVLTFPCSFQLGGMAP